MTPELLRQLLSEGESSRLDYKVGQYPFVGATDGEKSELLKDVVAMANAWREADAFIVIGVKEVPGKPAELVGISQHLDDAQLQQFVNSKVNRPIQFAYGEHSIEGHSIGVIRIPL